MLFSAPTTGSNNIGLYLEVAAGFLFVGLIILCVFIAVCVCRRKKGGYTAGETSYYWDIMIIVS